MPWGQLHPPPGLGIHSHCLQLRVGRPWDPQGTLALYDENAAAKQLVVIMWESLSSRLLDLRLLREFGSQDFHMQSLDSLKMFAFNS